MEISCNVNAFAVFLHISLLFFTFQLKKLLLQYLRVLVLQIKLCFSYAHFLNQSIPFNQLIEIDVPFIQVSEILMSSSFYSEDYICSCFLTHTHTWLQGQLQRSYVIPHLRTPYLTGMRWFVPPDVCSVLSPECFYWLTLLSSNSYYSQKTR